MEIGIITSMKRMKNSWSIHLSESRLHRKILPSCSSIRVSMESWRRRLLRLMTMSIMAIHSLSTGWIHIS